jgi:hypothetical protein
MIYLKEYGNKFMKLLGNYCNLNPQTKILNFEMLFLEDLVSHCDSKLWAR